MWLVIGCEHMTRSWCKKEGGLRIVDGRLFSLPAVSQLSRTWKKQRLISEVSKLCFEMTKKTSTFIIHIQKRHNHWSALLSAIKLHSAMVSFLLPMIIRAYQFGVQFGHIILVWSQFGNIFNHGQGISYLTNGQWSYYCHGLVSYCIFIIFN